MKRSRIDLVSIRPCVILNKHGSTQSHLFCFKRALAHFLQIKKPNLLNLEELDDFRASIWIGSFQDANKKASFRHKSPRKERERERRLKCYITKKKKRNLSQWLTFSSKHALSRKFDKSALKAAEIRRQQGG